MIATIWNRTRNLYTMDGNKDSSDDICVYLSKGEFSSNAI